MVKKNIYMHLFCWCTPSIILFSGFIFKTYGKSSGPWCEIVADPQTHFFMVSIWMIIVMVALIVNYGFIVYKLRSVILSTGWNGGEDGNYNRLHVRMRKVMRTVGFYPVAFMTQWLPGLYI